MSSSSTAKPQAHRRVWNKSNFSNTHITLKIVAIKNLPSGSFFSKGKYFMRIALGGNDPVSTKSNSTATFSEEFSADIDFDDQIIFKLFDEKKVERSDGSVEPVGKLAIPMRKIPLGEQEKDFKMKGTHGVEMTLRTTLVKNEIQPGRIYRKMFGYPVWMSDKYGVNFVDPDLETLEVGLTTLVRYAIKWLRGQRMIALSGKAFKFNLIDLSLSYHNRAMALAVVYTWIETTEALPSPTSSSSSAEAEAEKEDTDDEDEEEEDKGPKVMKAKMFSMPFKTLPKKTIQSFKPLPEEKYTKEFKAMIDGFDQIYRMAEVWMEENSHHYAEIYKVQVFSSDVSHHAVVWYN